MTTMNCQDPDPPGPNPALLRTDPSDRRRRARRVETRVLVRLWLNAAIHDSSARTTNLSVDGMFVETSHPLPVGSIARFELCFPEEAPIEGLAEVTWIRPRYEGRDRPNGMGVCFRPLKADAAQRLRSLLLERLDEAGNAAVHLRERKL